MEMTATTELRQVAHRKKVAEGLKTAVSSGDVRYKVVSVAIDRILPSPENVDLYGNDPDDSQFDALVESIRKRGLAEPLLLSKDFFVASGHRRLAACQQLGWKGVPCRFLKEKRAGADDWHRTLTEFNPQRIKSVSALVKERILSESIEDTQDLIDARRNVDAERLQACDLMTVERVKQAHAISERRQPFLTAVVKVVEDMRAYWPLSVRQIHYQLLNAPPLTQRPQRSAKNIESFRYRNDARSYLALVRLCRDARYSGALSMMVIDDPTRPQIVPRTHPNVSEFINDEVSYFLTGYDRNKMGTQPLHLECFGEKGTLKTILAPVCAEFQIPLSLGRGFCSIPVWRDITDRCMCSHKDKMLLLIVSDYDPEGLELADDAVRSLRDLHGVNVEAVRVAVTAEQIADLQLVANPAKKSSSRFNSFVKRTGSTDTYECEALPPRVLQDALRDAISKAIDNDLYDAEVEQEEEDVGEIHAFRRQIVEGMDCV